MTLRVLPGLGITSFWGTGYNGWGDQHDIDNRMLSVLVQCKVLSRVGALPGSPSNGDIYLLTSDNTINARDNGAWVAYTAVEGFVVWVADEDRLYAYTGAAWHPVNRYPISGKDLSTKSSGTLTPTPEDGEFQYVTNGGAFTLAPPSVTGDYRITLLVTNNASAGAITTSGFTKVVSTFDTTNTHKFLCHITKLNGATVLEIVQLF